MLGLVWPDKTVTGWSPGDEIGQVFEPAPLSALRTIYETDAHFVPYWLEGEDYCPRMRRDVPESFPLRFQLIPLDCEGPGHSSSPAWRANFRAKVTSLGWAFYETRGGARALFQLEAPVDRRQFETIQRRAAQALVDLGVDVDTTVLGQWHRCYRLPFVFRDGEQQALPSGGLRNIPVIDPSTLPRLDWNSPDASGRAIAGVELPLSSADNVGEGGRNDYLTRCAGSLRSKGLTGAALLEQLGILNEDRCDPPLPTREVAAIARSAEHWERESRRAEPEQIEDDTPLPMGDEVTVAKRILAELPEDTVGDRGALWSYDDTLGVWLPRDADDLARRAARFSGFPVAAGLDKHGHEKFVKLHLRNAQCKGIAEIALRQHRTPKFFDREQPGIAFANGFFGLQGLVAHSPSHRARSPVPFDYVPGSRPDAFIQFLEQVFEPEEEQVSDLVELIRQIIGVYAFGLATRFQRAFILLGEGSNGKSVLLDVVRAVFPDEKAVTSISPQEWGQEYRRARLASARLNLVAELPEVRMMSSEKVKGIISGDWTEGRAIQGTPFDFKPRAGHLFAANALPGVNDHSAGFWRRWKVIPFNRKFEDGEKDRGLTGRLIETQRALILSWAADSVAEVIRNGDYVIPECCERETRAWRVRADQISCFLDEDEVVSGPKWSMTGKQLYQRYIDWARQNGHSHLSNRVFGARVVQVSGISRVRKSAGMLYTKEPLLKAVE